MQSTNYVWLVVLVFAMGCVSHPAKAVPRNAPPDSAAAAGEQGGPNESVRLGADQLTRLEMNEDGTHLVSALQFVLCQQSAWPGTAPEILSAIKTVLPFNGMTGSWALIDGTDPAGLPVLLAEQPAEEAVLGSMLDTSVEWEPLGSKGYMPPLGIHGGRARFIAWDFHANGVLVGNPPGSGICWQHIGMLEGSPMESGAEPVTGLRHASPILSTESARLGYMVWLLSNTINDHTWKRSPAAPPTSLGEFAVAAGGVNPDAWINPYTAAPMRDVPLDDATAGDYTELAHPEGVFLVFHYRDVEGKVSSVVIGNRGRLSGGAPTNSTGNKPQAPAVAE